LSDALEKISGYGYGDSALGEYHDYLLPAVLARLDEVRDWPGGRRIFELGCGNGAIAHALAARGFEMTGVDTSEQGIAAANLAYPALKLRPGSAYDDLRGQYGQFPVVLSLEVVEHVYFPRKFAATLHDLLLPGGVAIISTPFHGYWKNLLLALSGKMDAHFTALWDYGHIKFWSVKTLRALLTEAGFEDISIQGVGRIAPLAKSMIAVARKKSA